MARNRHSYRHIGKFSTWLYTIALKLARTDYGKRKRRRPEPLRSVNRDGEEYEMVIPDTSFSPERHAESVLQYRYIQDALKRIRPEYR